MTRYLLDTSTLVDFSKNIGSVVRGFEGMIAAEEEVGVCSGAVAEFVSGVPADQRPRWLHFIESLRYWPATVSTAFRAGIYRFDLARQGRAISTTDALTAALAVEIDAPIVTDNLRDFPMPEVRVISLRALR